jgi:hypothetical protein
LAAVISGSATCVITLFETAMAAGKGDHDVTVMVEVIAACIGPLLGTNSHPGG